MKPIEGMLRSECFIGKDFSICQTVGKMVKGVTQERGIWEVKLETVDGHPEYYALTCPWDRTHTLEAKHDGNQETLACKGCDGIWLAIIEKDNRLEYYPKSVTADFTEEGEIPILDNGQINFVKDTDINMTTEMKSQPSLVESRESARQKIQARIDIGYQLRDPHIGSEDELEKTLSECGKWSSYNETLLSRLFTDSSIADSYRDFRYQRPLNSENPLVNPSLEAQMGRYRERMTISISSLEGIYDKLDLFDEPTNTLLRSSDSAGTKIFIGHGHSPDWRELKDFINERLKLPYDEFNRIPVAGLTTTNRLAEMLNQACMAFLVMTAEDEQADGALRARENVVHEAGLFQGKLGFEKAIVLLEEGCEEFSNIHGLGQLRFPKGNISAIFEKVREVLEREGILEGVG